MREIRTSGSEGGGSETNRCSPPLFGYEGTEQAIEVPGQARPRS
jgi:hypothetical protein